MSSDMSKQAVSARIAEVGRLAVLETARRLETKIDLSPAAITRRLEQVERLRVLCLSLRRVAPEGPGDDEA